MNDKGQDSKLRSHLAMEYMQKAAQGGNDRAKDFISKFGSHFISVLNTPVQATDAETHRRHEPREQSPRRKHDQSKVRPLAFQASLALLINKPNPQ